MRAGANYRHIAHENIKELGQFINITLTEKATDWCYPVIVFGNLLHICIIIYPEAPEFKAIERLVALARPGLNKKYRSF